MFVCVCVCLSDFHPPVHSNSRECEDWNIDRDRLNEEHHVAHRPAENPPTGVEGVGEGERDAGDAHEHVREGQVPDEEVGDVVHLAGPTDDVEEQVVTEDAHHHDQHVRGDDERLEGLQQGHVCKLGAVVAGAAVNAPVCLTAVIYLHGSNLDTQKQWFYSQTLSIFQKVTRMCSVREWRLNFNSRELKMFPDIY